MISSKPKWMRSNRAKMQEMRKAVDSSRSPQPQDTRGAGVWRMQGPQLWALGLGQVGGWNSRCPQPHWGLPMVFPQGLCLAHFLARLPVRGPLWGPLQRGGMPSAPEALGQEPHWGPAQGSLQMFQGLVQPQGCLHQVSLSVHLMHGWHHVRWYSEKINTRLKHNIITSRGWWLEQNGKSSSNSAQQHMSLPISALVRHDVIQAGSAGGLGIMQEEQ